MSLIIKNWIFCFAVVAEVVIGRDISCYRTVVGLITISSFCSGLESIGVFYWNCEPAWFMLDAEVKIVAGWIGIALYGFVLRCLALICLSMLDSFLISILSDYRTKLRQCWYSLQQHVSIILLLIVAPRSRTSIIAQYIASWKYLHGGSHLNIGQLSSFPTAHSGRIEQGAFYVLGEQIVRHLNRSRDLLTIMSVEDAMVGIWLLGIDKVQSLMVYSSSYDTIMGEAMPSLWLKARLSQIYSV